MKNIIIFGCPRAGKTTLAKRLNQELNYNIISVDSLVTAFQKVFPEMQITHSSNIIQKDQKLTPFLYEYIERAIWEYTDRYFIMEGWHMLPDTLIPMIDKNKYVVICLGYPNAKIEDLYQKIRTFDTEHDNTKSKNDDYVRDLIKRSKQESIMLKQQSEKWNIPFWETDENRQEVFSNIMEYVKKEIEK